MSQEGSQISGPSEIKTTKVVYPQLYSYTLPDIPANTGSQKIGYTGRQDVDKRIFEQTNTAAMRLRAEKQWSAPAFFADGKTDFNDKTFDRFLLRAVLKRSILDDECRSFKGTPCAPKELFDTFPGKVLASTKGWITV